MAYDEKLADRIRESLLDRKGIIEKKMFGGVAFMQKEKMFVGIVKDELMLRVMEAKEPEALEHPHARPMDFTGRPMKGFLFISPEGFKSKKQLESWLALGLEYVKLSPAKKKKKK
jgi:TfoX/Sxy family transcriptional regulator of competence genes